MQIYGDSYGGLQAGIANESAQRERALELSIARDIGNQRYGEQQKLAKEETGYRRFREMTGDIERRAGNAKAETRADAYLKLQQDQMGRGIWDEADDFADQGAFGSVEDVKRLFPDMPDQIAQRKVEWSAHSREIMGSQFDDDSSAAEFLNNYAKAQEDLRQTEELAKQGGIFWDSQKVNQAQAQLESKRKQVGNMAILARDIQKNYGARLRLDPKAGAYSPKFTPKWLREAPLPDGTPGGAGGSGAGRRAGAGGRRSVTAQDIGATQGEHSPQFYAAVDDLVTRGMSLPQAVARILRMQSGPPAKYSGEYTEPLLAGNQGTTQFGVVIPPTGRDALQLAPPARLVWPGMQPVPSGFVMPGARSFPP